jgi:hypothetical protein
MLTLYKTTKPEPEKTDLLLMAKIDRQSTMA